MDKIDMNHYQKLKLTKLIYPMGLGKWVVSSVNYLEKKKGRGGYTCYVSTKDRIMYA